MVADVAITDQRVQPRIVEMRLAGGGTGHKDLSRRHPPLLRFVSVQDHQLHDELRRLSLTDIEARRRNRGWAPEPIDLSLDDGTQLVGVLIRPPVNAPGGIAVLDFGVHHEDLD